MTKNSDYIEHIDFLRAISVIFVILFHLGNPLIPGGFLGVDVFFVISGFLITRNINKELLHTGKFNLKNFYIRRIRRLIPSLFLMFLFTFILGFLIFPPSLFTGLIESMFFSSFAASNFYFLSQTNYFDVSANLKPLLHTWSLAIEEQFYLFYPLTFLLLFKILKKAKYIIFALVTIFLLSLIFNFISSEGYISEKFIGYFISDPNFSDSLISLQFFFLPFRVFEFVIGGLLVFISFKGKILKNYLNLLGLVIIIISVFCFSSETEYMSTLNLFPCIGAALFICNEPNEFISKIYNLNIFKITGKISYTLYLFHWPIIVFYSFIYGFEFTVIENILLLLAMFLISYIVYNYFETPLRAYKNKPLLISNHGLISLILLCIIIISNIKTSVINSDGWVWRVDNKKIENLKLFEDPKKYQIKNWGAAGYEKYGFLGKLEKRNSIDMIWMGDSHAGHYSFGLDSIMVKKHKKKTFMSYKISTLHLPDIIHKRIDSTKTKSHLNSLIRLINSNPKTPVFISHFWNGEMASTKVKNSKTNSYENFKIDSTGYKELCEKIVQFSKILSKRDIIIIGENPFKSKHDLSYVDNLLVPKYFSNMNPQSYFTPSAHSFAINSYFRDYFNKFTNIHFINPSDVFCEDNMCIEQENGEIYFSDKDHLSKLGSLKVIKSIEKKLLKFINKSATNSTGNNINIVDIDTNNSSESNFIEPNQIINHNSKKLKFKNWYGPEAKHRWSCDNYSELIFNIKDKKKFKGTIEINHDVLGKQVVKILLNDSIIYNNNISGRNKKLTLYFTPKSLNNMTKNTLRFEYSNPMQPRNSKDRRVLALAFKNIIIN
ncbi:acyltransferase family protein [Neotamlana nanhaiensis]|nr:acyltransferase family protein [Tamlana nanhaiensis]